MPDIFHTLHGSDLGFLKMVAGLWGLELDAPNVRKALPQLTGWMLNPDLANEVVESLPASAMDALRALTEAGGIMPWPHFTRQFGEVRSMGAARRDRERPDLNPDSPAEILWYHGLVGQAFLDQPPEPQQFAYIPEDLLGIINVPGTPPADQFGRPASPGETAVIIPASDRILDHACMLLAALRLGMPPEQIPSAGWQIPLPDLRALLFAAGLLDRNGLPMPEPVRQFLEAPRGQALRQLAVAWLHSSEYNELRLLPGYLCEGDWSNDSLHARSRLVEHLSRLPQDSWWSIGAFVADLHQKDPDFQRPAGDYDSWFIRRADSDQYLSGFASWDAVDGAVARAVISGPLHWLGYFDLAAPAPNAPASAFRPSVWAADLWMEQDPSGLPAEKAAVTVHSDGRLDTPHLTPRAARYQLARFTAWEGDDDAGYHYRVTPASLERARRQGLQVSHLIKLLKKHTAAQLPPSLLTALERWEQHGTEAYTEEVLLLRVSRPEILTALRKHRASRFLGEELTPLIVVVRPGGSQQILQALAELGYLAETRMGSEV